MLNQRRLAIASRATAMVVLAASVSAVSTAAGVVSAHATDAAAGSRSSRNDVSPPLRALPDTGQRTGWAASHAPLRAPRPGSRKAAAPSPTTAAAVPATATNFDGVGNGFTGPAGTFAVRAAPPDTNAAVGPNHVV